MREWHDIHGQLLSQVREMGLTPKKEAADYLTVKKAHDAAQSELLSIRKDLESMTTKYTQLKSSKDINWLMTGAGVLLCGLFMGLIFGRREKKRKSSYY